MLDQYTFSIKPYVDGAYCPVDLYAVAGADADMLAQSIRWISHDGRPVESVGVWHKGELLYVCDGANTYAMEG